MTSEAAYANWRSGEGRQGRRCWRPLEILAIVGGFILFWPVGVALLVWKCLGYPSWQEARSEFGERFRSEFGGFGRDLRGFRQGRRYQGRGPGRQGGSGNIAFEEYRQRELERLEEERRKLDEESRAFAEFVEELKRAKDREEFDAFMTRRRSQGGPDVQENPTQA